MRNLILLTILATAPSLSQTSDTLTENVTRAAQRLTHSDRTTVRLRSSATDQQGVLHARFEQLHDGVRVLGSQIAAHVPRVAADATLTAKLFSDISLNARAAMPKSTALAVAVQAWGRANEDLNGDDLQAELVIRPLQELSVRGDDQRGEAIYEWRARSFQLLWRVEASPRDAGPKVVLVDALSGALEFWDSANYDQIQQAPIPPNATAKTYAFGSKGITTRFNQTTQLWELVDPTRGNSAVRNQNYSTTRKASSGLLYTDVNNSWGDAKLYEYINGPTSINGQTAAADAAFDVQTTWDMLLNVFKRSGLNGAGKAIETRVHFGLGYADSFWVDSEQTAFFGDGTGKGITQPRTVIDTVGHELGHGLWFYELGPDGGAGTESDGLNEGHADIMGSLVEMYQKVGGTGSVFPEETFSWNWRDRMVNPLNYNWDIKDAQNNVIGNSVGVRYYTPSVGKAEEHANGCLYGHFFVILARGSSTDAASQLFSKFRPLGTAGIGVLKAARIWYLATTAFMPPEPSYLDTRSAYLSAAKQLYGAASAEYKGVREAWAAIGLSEQPQDSLSLKL